MHPQCRELGCEGDTFRLELILPGAVLVRQQALWHWLRRSEDAKAFFLGHSPIADVVSVADALQSALAPGLSAGLGKTVQAGVQLQTLSHMRTPLSLPAELTWVDILLGSPSKHISIQDPAQKSCYSLQFKVSKGVAVLSLSQVLRSTVLVQMQTCVCP